ncbi:MAG: YjiH family protein [Oscillospiraceae bacterium]|nr:YjiH family protein [Oscillospiraceae bacterium]
MSQPSDTTLSKRGLVKFILFSLLGMFLFLAPIPDGEGAFNIPLGFAIDWLRGLLGGGVLTTYGSDTDFAIHHLLALIVITLSFVGTLVTYLFKPKFIMNNDKLREIFRSSPIYFISKLIGFAVVWMIFLGWGPDFVINAFTGDEMMGLTASLMVVFIILVPAIPILTKFGLMEFFGVLIRKAVRFLFRLPGRASIDLMASWFGSSAASVIITRDQHEKGFYTGREAAVIATNFSFVSLPFTLVVADTIGLRDRFWLFYLVVCVVCILLAMIMPRIWPLRKLNDDYLPEVGKQIHEEVPENMGIFRWALRSATKSANETTPGQVARAGAYSYLNIFMDLIPIILAWGTVALIIFEFTPIFDWVSWPMGQLLRLLQVEGAMYYAPATLVGFFDMFIPALLLPSAPQATRFILGTLSIVQVIYLAETGVLILKSKMPLNIGKLFAIFIIRTLIALPIIVGLTWLLF